MQKRTRRNNSKKQPKQTRKNQRGGNVDKLRELIADILIGMFSIIIRNRVNKPVLTHENIVTNINDEYKYSGKCFQKIPSNILDVDNIRDLHEQLESISITNKTDDNINLVNETILNYIYFNYDDREYEMFYFLFGKMELKDKLIKLYPQLELSDEDYENIDREREENDKKRERIKNADISTLSSADLEVRKIGDAFGW